MFLKKIGLRLLSEHKHSFLFPIEFITLDVLMISMDPEGLFSLSISSESRISPPDFGHGKQIFSCCILSDGRLFADGKVGYGAIVRPKDELEPLI